MRQNNYNTVQINWDGYNKKRKTQPIQFFSFIDEVMSYIGCTKKSEPLFV